MNQAQRQERQFDDAAEQAKAEGVSSLGIGFDHFPQRYIALCAAAAQCRDCTFSIDIDGAGMFTYDY